MTARLWDIGGYLTLAALVACGSEEPGASEPASPVTAGAMTSATGGPSVTSAGTGSFSASVGTTGASPTTAGVISGVGGQVATDTSGATITSTTGQVTNQELTPPATPHRLCQIAMACQEPIPDDRDSDERVICDFAITDADGVAQYAAYAGVKRRGRSSRNYPKANYSVELWDELSQELSPSLFGMGGDADWVLDGMWLDRGLVRNSLVYDLFRSIGGRRYAAKGRYCTLTLNGDAQGLYRLGERVKRDDDRIDLVEDDGTGQSFVIKQHMNGVLRMPVQPGGGFQGGGSGDQTNWQLIYPNQSRATDAQEQGVQGFLDGLLDARENDPDSIFTSFLDLDATADWILINELAKNIDAFHLSIHLFRDAGGLAHFVPWDFDLSMGQPTVQESDDNQEPQGWVYNHSLLLEQMLESDLLRARLATRWDELRQGPLSTRVVGAWLDSYFGTLEPSAVAENFSIWPIEDVDFQQIYPSYTLYDVNSHSEESALLRAWLEARLTWMDANLGSYPN